MVKYKIELDRDICIGTFSCSAAAENFWLEGDDGMVNLANAVYNEETEKWELIIDENDFATNRDAEDGCPVDAIKITKIAD